MKKHFSRILIISALAVAGFSCKRSVTRVAPDTQIDLSGRWNSTDSKMVAQEMVHDVMVRPWRANFFDANKKKPTVIVGYVLNKTTELIDADVFIKDVEIEFINTGLVRVVQNSDFREKIRSERADQQQNSSLETAKKFGKELGADFMMFGTISSVLDQYKKKKAVFYKTTLELSDMETNEKVWIGNKEIQKFIKN
jgi:uncharacterized protein (TIGR02722 family)